MKYRFIIKEISAKKLAKEFPNFEKVIQILAELDPSHSDKYIDWAFNQYKKEIPRGPVDSTIVDWFNPNLENISSEATILIGRIIDALTEFDKNVNTYRSSSSIETRVRPDIYGYRDLESLEKDVFFDKNRALEESDVFLSNKDLFVARPLTHFASCVWGKNTAPWCISDPGRHYYQDYSRKGKIFVQFNLHNLAKIYPDLAKITYQYDSPERYEGGGEVDEIWSQPNYSIHKEQGEQYITLNYILASPTLRNFLDGKLDFDHRGETDIELGDIISAGGKSIEFGTDETPLNFGKVCQELGIENFNLAVYETKSKELVRSLGEFVETSAREHPSETGVNFEELDRMVDVFNHSSKHFSASLENDEYIYVDASLAINIVQLIRGCDYSEEFGPDDWGRIGEMFTENLNGNFRISDSNMDDEGLYISIEGTTVSSEEELRDYLGNMDDRDIDRAIERTIEVLNKETEKFDQYQIKQGLTRLEKEYDFQYDIEREIVELWLPLGKFQFGIEEFRPVLLKAYFKFLNKITFQGPIDEEHCGVGKTDGGLLILQQRFMYGEVTEEELLENSEKILSNFENFSSQVELYIEKELRQLPLKFESLRNFFGKYLI